MVPCYNFCIIPNVPFNCEFVDHITLYLSFDSLVIFLRIFSFFFNRHISGRDINTYRHTVVFACVHYISYWTSLCDTVILPNLHSGAPARHRTAWWREKKETFVHSLLRAPGSTSILHFAVPSSDPKQPARWPSTPWLKEAGTGSKWHAFER